MTENKEPDFGHQSDNTDQISHSPKLDDKDYDENTDNEYTSLLIQDASTTVSSS